SFHKTACSDGIRTSCEWLRARAEPRRRAWEQSCDDGDAASCRALASLLTSHSSSFPSMPGDAAHAESLLRRACAAGHRTSCEDADRMASHSAELALDGW